MTACVDNKEKKGGAAKAVSATLAGVLAVACPSTRTGILTVRADLKLSGRVRSRPAVCDVKSPQNSTMLPLVSMTVVLVEVTPAASVTSSRAVKEV